MGSSVADTIRRIAKDSFPVLILAYGKGRSCEVTSIIQGKFLMFKMSVWD